MLFLYRPRQTWMPFARPMNRDEQATYNLQRDTLTALKELGALHASGGLTDAEFELAKAKVLAP